MTKPRRAKRIVQLFLCLFFSLFFYVFVSAQYRIDSWTTENGLPQNSVNNLLKDKDGYIWGVTFGGIFRFDGVRFKVFDQSNTEGLKESRFRRIREDKDGRLWFFSETRSDTISDVGAGERGESIWLFKKSVFT